MTVRKYLKLEISISSFKQKNKLVRLVFGRIYGAPICLQFYLTFSSTFTVNKVNLGLRNATDFFLQEILHGRFLAA